MSNELATTTPAGAVIAHGTTATDLRTAWLLSLRSDNTRAAYARDLQKFVLWCAGVGVEPLTARRPVVDAYRETLTHDGARPTTVARALAALSSFFRYAESVGAVPANPVAAITRPRTGEAYVALTPALTSKEAARLLAACQTPRERLLVALLAVQALRVSEALGINLEDVQPERGHQTVRITGKGGSEARIPLAPVVLAALEDVRESEGRTTGPALLDTLGERMSRHSAAWLLDKLARRAGLDKKVTPHQLRATAVTVALDNGAGLRDVQDFARHASPVTTRRYDRNRGALDRMAALTGALSAALVA